MSEHRQHFVAQRKSPQLKPVLFRIALPGDGYLDVSYRLVKGISAEADNFTSKLGINPESNEIESYFSTQDSATLQLSFENVSDYNLKHLRVLDVRLFSVGDETTPSAPADEARLPDGNLFFEIVPGDVYFGHLSRGTIGRKYLALVTRGVLPGLYQVRFEMSYDIEGLTARAKLDLPVNPD